MIASSAVTQLQQQLGRFNILGMFDNIVISKSRLLGIDEKINKYLSLIEDEKVCFQTKDFDQSLSTYYIKDDSLIREEREYEWVDDKDHFLKGYMKTISTEMVPYDITTTIVCYDYSQTETLDFSVDFKIVFINGKVKEISLERYEEKDAAPRIEREKEWAEKHKISLAFSKTIRGKCQRQLSKILYKIGKIILSIGSKIQHLSFKL